MCGNPQMGFPCSCTWSENNPGEILFSCEFCGIYKAGKPQCGECEDDE